MAKKRNLLVIDDNEGILEAFQAMLEDAGYEVKTSTDADVLKKLTPQTAPDLILLDVLLSGADGRDVCKELRSHKDTENIPVIMISAHPGIERSVKESGATDFLTKPFEMDELLGIVKKHLA